MILLSMQVNCTFPVSLTLQNIDELELCWVNDFPGHLSCDPAPFGQHYFHWNHGNLSITDDHVKETHVGKKELVLIECDLLPYSVFHKLLP